MASGTEMPAGRLWGFDYSGDIPAAIRGERVPAVIGKLGRLCVVRGVRHHDGFAQELYGNPEYPEITRALNARAIMSNRIPEMNDPEHFPYCFWHPDVPEEQILRRLLEKYPGNQLLRYQVGRACAAGGYTTLYHELGLLPDVAIAEEARDNAVSGGAIFEAIIHEPIRYACMHDYQRCLRVPPVPNACLNGDTCVRSFLDRTLHVDDFNPNEPPVFDITEDWCLANDGLRHRERPVDPEAVRLLCNPLPRDLTTVDKDLLILMAAWSGNIDRYTRLRRPKMLYYELPCVIRGIYHHPFFSKWWSMQPDNDLIPIRQAVNARSIMNNDLTWLDDTTPDNHLPILIWHPQRAGKDTYAELARRRPSMIPQIARACMHADYQDLFDELDPAPDVGLWRDAKHCTNKYYLERIENVASEQGIDLNALCASRLRKPDVVEHDYWTTRMLQQEMEPTWDGTQSNNLERAITLDHIGLADEYIGGISSIVGSVILHACVADRSAIPNSPYDSLDLWEVYRDARYVESEEDRKMVGLAPNPRRPRGGYRGRRRGRLISKS
ncbi:hypothetical protein BJX96DRAFT_153939 [Aspergillus floccosus]